MRQGIGWIGALLILGAYFAVSGGFLLPTDFLYQMMNLVGSLGIIIVALQRKDYQPLVLNIIWVCIASFALLQIFRL